jgi:hypothetical protein
MTDSSVSTDNVDNGGPMDEVARGFAPAFTVNDMAIGAIATGPAQGVPEGVQTHTQPA